MRYQLCILGRESELLCCYLATDKQFLGRWEAMKTGPASTDAATAVKMPGVLSLFALKSS